MNAGGAHQKTLRSTSMTSHTAALAVSATAIVTGLSPVCLSSSESFFMTVGYCFFPESFEEMSASLSVPPGAPSLP